MCIVIETSSDSKATCDNISQNLLESKLSPCISISNKSNSSYIWKENVISSKEHTIRIKCLKKDKKQITDIIKNLHNYSTPEIISYDNKILDKKYDKWFKESLDKND